MNSKKRRTTKLLTKSKRHKPTLRNLCHIAVLHEEEQDLDECLNELGNVMYKDDNVIQSCDDKKILGNNNNTINNDTMNNNINKDIHNQINQLPIVAPNVKLEMIRHTEVYKLSSFLLERVPNLRMPAFERWLIDSKMEEKCKKLGIDSDPILSLLDMQTSMACQNLMEEICEVNESRMDAERIVSQLCDRVNRSVRYLNRLKSEEKGCLNRRCKILVERDSLSVSLSLDRSKGKNKGNKNMKRQPFVVKLNRSHYQKLHLMYRNHLEGYSDTHTDDFTGPIEFYKQEHTFHMFVFALLIRYSALSGGQLLKDLRGGGMQGALHDEVFDYLAQELGVKIELFASPFNSFFSSYGSAFADLDRMFGSLGDFFNENNLLNNYIMKNGGCYECNPPFSPILMELMVNRLELLLDRAKKCLQTLSFVIVVPSAAQSGKSSSQVKMFAAKSFLKMIESEFCRKHIILKARDHGYKEASQHLRPTQFKESQYDTSVIILSTKNLLNDEKSFEEGLKLAFESKHKAETLQRKVLSKP